MDSLGPLFDLAEVRPPARPRLPDGLRPYQADAVERLRGSVAKGHKAPLLAAPCGSGKTIIARALIDGAVEKRNSVLFLAPRRELIYQTGDKLDAIGLAFGIIMAGEQRSLGAQVQVASVATIQRRLKEERIQPPPANVVIIDEAHLSISKTTLDVLSHYDHAIKIGLTATPCRTDGRGLGEIFDDLIIGPSIVDLIDSGFLVPPKYFAPTVPDLSGIRMMAGDYNQKQLSARMDDPILVGDVIDNWTRLASDRQTIVFAVDVAHSLHLLQCFQDAGVSAEHIDANTPRFDRESIMRRFHNGDIQVICNCQIFCYGIDCPPASACVLAHPTKSISRYHQQVGRVLRPFEGKEDCLIIDHAGIVNDLGFVEDEIPWGLNGRQRVRERLEKVERKEPKPLTCPECSATFTGSGICPECGHDMTVRFAAAVRAVEAELREVRHREEKAKKRRANKQWTTDEKQAFYSGLISYGAAKGYKSGWASHQYRSRFGVWPNALEDIPMRPNKAVKDWIKSRNIAYRKAKEKEAATA